METYSQHGLLSCKLGNLGHELVPPLWWEYAVEPCRSLIQHPADRALKAASNAADCFCHGYGECLDRRGSFYAEEALSRGGKVTIQRAKWLQMELKIKEEGKNRALSTINAWRVVAATNLR